MNGSRHYRSNRLLSERRRAHVALRESYLRNTPPTRPGQLMSEARADMLADQLLEVGFLGGLKKAAAGAMAVGGAIGKAFLGPVAAAAKTTAKAAAETMAAYAKAMAEIKDEAQKAKCEALKDTIRTQVFNIAKKTTSQGIKELVEVGMEEAEAKAVVSTILADAIAEAQQGSEAKVAA